MITASNTVKTLLEQKTSITQGIGCTLELNMNSMMDNLTIQGTDYQSQGALPNKKLFPADSIIKTFRPTGSGIRYAVSGNVGTYGNPKGVLYQIGRAHV